MLWRIKDAEIYYEVVGEETGPYYTWLCVVG